MHEFTESLLTEHRQNGLLQRDLPSRHAGTLV
jgi:hypothetical protein